MAGVVNFMTKLAGAWLDDATNLKLFDYIFKLAWTPTTLTDRTSSQGVFGPGAPSSRYDPFKRTRRALYGRADWRGGMPAGTLAGERRGLFG